MLKYNWHNRMDWNFFNCYLGSFWMIAHCVKVLWFKNIIMTEYNLRYINDWESFAFCKMLGIEMLSGVGQSKLDYEKESDTYKLRSAII